MVNNFIFEKEAIYESEVSIEILRRYKKILPTAGDFPQTGYSRMWIIQQNFTWQPGNHLVCVS